MLNPIIIIPSRLNATRLPRKPLADIAGKPMIVRVWEQAMKAELAPVIVATDSDEIANVIYNVGGKVVFTDPNLASGSDRVHAAIEQYDPEHTYNVAINLQGDLPNVQADALRNALLPLQDERIDVGTVCVPITNPRELEIDSVVKISLGKIDARGFARALYFSRNCIPSGQGPHYHHLGIYAYRRHILAQFVSLPVSELEQRERLEQLRIIEHGAVYGVGFTNEIPVTIDTPADLEFARSIIKS